MCEWGQKLCCFGTLKNLFLNLQKQKIRWRPSPPESVRLAPRDSQTSHRNIRYSRLMEHSLMHFQSFVSRHLLVIFRRRGISQEIYAYLPADQLLFHYSVACLAPHPPPPLPLVLIPPPPLSTRKIENMSSDVRAAAAAAAAPETKNKTKQTETKRKKPCPHRHLLPRLQRNTKRVCFC